MKEKLIVIDLLAEKGHLNLVKAVLRDLSYCFDVLFISSNEYCSKVGFKNYIGIDDSYYNWSSKLSFIKQQINVLRQVTKLVKRNDNVLFTSFENISLCLLWREYNALALLHNNIEKKGISRYFFKKISKRVAFMVYEDYMVNYVQKITNNNTYVVPHTLNFKANNMLKSKKDIVLVPSSSGIPEKELPFLIEFIKKNNLVLYRKSKKNNLSKYLVEQIYFENYYQLMCDAEFILLYSPYNYRVSGVFYEAMNLNKKILLLNNKSGKFLMEMKTLYPNSFYTITDYDYDIDINKKEMEHKQFLSKHSSHSVINCIKNAFENHMRNV